MNDESTCRYRVFVIVLIILSIFGNRLLQAGENGESSLSDLLPHVLGYESEAPPQVYEPGTLFEYINGAAEIYISYDFKALIVARYKKKDAVDTVAVEIYDMGNHKNSFGIYSAERFPDNQFVSIGTEGYLEEGSLNFFVGPYYVKLLCFDCENRADEMLQIFAEDIVNRVEDKAGFPDLLDAFPEEGRRPHTERFILRNFLGYRFLHDGYLTTYKAAGLEFDCFIIEGDSTAEAENMLYQYLDAKKKSGVQKKPWGFQVKDRYYHHIFLAHKDNIICGVMKIQEGFQKVGKEFLKKLLHSLGNRAEDYF